ncbi:hypothetical protein LJC08_01730, partial [Methanimicrococcus sp. OttesenSCG-928-J09]|nr:hypothetical protein [Methanimicrococcus sp. OttesenSCG-928-J09]
TVTYNPGSGAFADANPRTEILTLSGGSATVLGIAEKPIQATFVFSNWNTADVPPASVAPGITTVDENTTFAAVYVAAQAINIDGTTVYSTDLAHTIYDVSSVTINADFAGLSLSTIPDTIATATYDSTENTITFAVAPSGGDIYKTEYFTDVTFIFNSPGTYTPSTVVTSVLCEGMFIEGFSYPSTTFGLPKDLWTDEFDSLGAPLGSGTLGTFDGWSDALPTAQDPIVITTNMDLYAIWT